MLLEARDEDGVLTDTQVRDHIMTFFAAGHETTANALTWTFHLLSQHPAGREKLLAELQTVLAGRAPTVDDFPNLPYTEWVLNESMRIYPPAWMLGRRAIEAFDLDGVHFPAGTIVMFSQWVIHRLPDLWGDSENFRPERWDPASERKIVPWSYFPFGGGPRICIGLPFAQLEARLLLATILQHYLPFTAPGFRAEPDPLITLRPKKGLQSILMPTTANAGSGPGAERLLPQLPFAQQDMMGERKGRRGALWNWFKFLRR
jgi:cytochrome P450